MRTAGPNVGTWDRGRDLPKKARLEHMALLTACETCSRCAFTDSSALRVLMSYFFEAHFEKVDSNTRFLL